IRITISSVTSDSLWRCTWSVYPDFATMTLTKADGHYWFLYEGTPGGVLEENQDYLVLSDGTRHPLSESWVEDLPAQEWLYFADGTADRSLVLIHHADDTALDQYWPMEGNMTVFGFGREYPCCDQYLSEVPAQFTIGVVESREYAEIAEFVQMIRQEPDVKLGRVELRSEVE
ncbi:MAG TPA: hypothetical protein VKA68_04870, partial [bacterium]|nr:hypothetical protein [bacterium]